ncbi:MAG: sigma-70 family RNA polymerase sigma factor [Acidimicrobiia bacterium]|nr:sigma-70 family RNA polymerase sigma factor [Acidimicrobiia bacterium]
MATLYRSVAPAVLGYMRGHGASEPEDLTSEVFVGVMRALSRFRGDESDFRSWVFTIAHRRLVDERRSNARISDRHVGPHEPGVTGPSYDGPEDAILDRLAARPVVRALEDLTPDQRSVVLLRIIADLPVADVACILGKREGAVKTLQRRALAALARAVEPAAVR